MDAIKTLPARIFRKDSTLLATILLAAIGVVAYANSVDNSFHFDDIVGVVRNPAIRDLRNIPAYFTDPSTFGLGRTREWRPILQTSYALNYAIAGLKPSIFRTFNFLFHLGSALLIFLILREITGKLPPERRAPPLVALFAAALFTVHTANTEAVDYIWARSSVLATLFFLLSLYCYLRGPFGGEKSNRIAWPTAGLLFFALGMGTKATAVTLPGVLVLYEIIFLNPAAKNPFKLFWQEPRRIKKYLPLAAVFLAYLAVRTFFLPRLFTSVAVVRPVSAFSYLLTQFRAWIYYCKLFLWPDPLIVDFPGFGWSHSLWDAKVLLSLGAVIAILVTAWSVRKRQPLVSFFTCWFFIALLPEAGFIPLADAVVGYRAYPAYVGLAVVVTMLGYQALMWIQRRFGSNESLGFRLGHGLVAALVLAALTGATIVRNRDWRDETTLWADAVKKDPGNSRAYMMLGAQYLYGENYLTALELFDKAIQIAPRRSHVYLLRGYLNSRLNRPSDALADFDRAMTLDPRDPYAHFYRGEFFKKIGEYDKALEDYRAALSAQPFYSDAYLGMAMAWLGKEDLRNATAACRKLVEIDPTDRRGYDCLGTLLMEQDRVAEAVKLYEAAVRRIPKDSELRYNLGIAYEKSGMYMEAAAAFETAGGLMSKAEKSTLDAVIPVFE